MGLVTMTIFEFSLQILLIILHKWAFFRSPNKFRQRVNKIIICNHLLKPCLLVFIWLRAHKSLPQPDYCRIVTDPARKLVLSLTFCQLVTQNQSVIRGIATCHQKHTFAPFMLGLRAICTNTYYIANPRFLHIVLVQLSRNEKSYAVMQIW